MIELNFSQVDLAVDPLGRVDLILQQGLFVMKLVKVDSLLGKFKLEVLSYPGWVLLVLDSLLLLGEIIFQFLNLELRLSFQSFDFEFILKIFIISLLLVSFDSFYILCCDFSCFIKLGGFWLFKFRDLFGLVDFFFTGHLDLLGSQPSFLPEFSLEILKESFRWNLNLSDLDGFKPDTPSFELIFEIVFHVIFQMVSIFKHLIQWGVGNEISQDRLTHGLHISICISSFHVFVTSEGSVFVSVHRPEGKSSDLYTLHFFGHIISSKRHLFNFRRKLDIAVSEWDECLQSDSCLDQFTSTDDQQPLVRLRLYKPILKKHSETADSNKKPTNPPDVPGRTEEDGWDETSSKGIEG